MGILHVRRLLLCTSYVRTSNGNNNDLMHCYAYTVCYSMQYMYRVLHEIACYDAALLQYLIN